MVDKKIVWIDMDGVLVDFSTEVNKTISNNTFLKEAYKGYLIDNEEQWLQMLKDRNLTSHTYDEKLADIIFNRAHTTEMAKLGGIRGVNSQFAFLFLVVVLSAVALPFTTGFVGEFLLILGVFESNGIAASFAGLIIILGAIYMLRAFQLIMLGDTNSLTLHFPKLTKQEIITLVIIVILIIGIGVYPKPLLDITENSVNILLQGIK